MSKIALKKSSNTTSNVNINKDKKLFFEDKIISLLFASANPLSEDKLLKLLNLKDKKTLRKYLRLAEKKLEFLPLKILLYDEKNKEYKMTVKKEYLEVVKLLTPETELSKTAIEILAIVAYNEPILQSEVISRIGTQAYKPLKLLREKNFIVRQPKGRSFILKLGENFYKYFEISEYEKKKIFSSKNFRNSLKEQKSLEDFEKEEYGRQ